MELEWRTLQALELRDKNKMLTNIETFSPMIWYTSLHHTHLHCNQERKSLDKTTLALWPLIQNLMILIIY